MLIQILYFYDLLAYVISYMMYFKPSLIANEVYQTTFSQSGFKINSSRIINNTKSLFLIVNKNLQPACQYQRLIGNRYSSFFSKNKFQFS